uniref:DNA-directed RNA polymerase n=1 Tax=Chromochloris zofingiensis TaxID=31302 RepID=A0A140HA32_9CHLO|nr:RNA polymerase beta subunit [Chromochloris zofingiensis]AMO01031.1 RNA polymerase beta subunit [Chromochloris zofingiensis]
MLIQRYYIPDLVEIQRQSFCQFLEKGMIEEFSKRNPITNLKKDMEVFFYPEYYQLTRPEYTIQQAVLYQKSYVSKIYIPVQLTDKKRKRLFLKWMLIGHLPLMTKQGHFLLNGSARVIVNQLIRSPGIYFRENIHEIYLNKWNDKPDMTLQRYYADIICVKGTWLRLEIDKDNSIWARMKKGPKIPMLWLLIAMGLTEKLIFTSIFSPYRLLNSFNKELDVLSKNPQKKLKYPYVSNPPEAWEKLSELMNLKKMKKSASLAELGRKWLFKKFMNPRTYDLGINGRFSLNKKLGLTLSNHQTTLTALDLLTATDFLLKVEKGIYGVDDIDHLKNRRIRSSGELVQLQFGIGLLRLEKGIRLKLNNFTITPTLNSLINTKPVNGAFKEFFGSNPLSQFMDQINPLAEITHKRRLTSLGPGGVSRDTATLEVRGIHPSHYGRICPIETPEGKNTGLVNSLTTFARVNLQGLLETPFYKIYKGQVQKDTGLIYLSADQEEITKVATADLNLSNLDFLPPQSIPARVGKNFTTLSRNDVDFIGVSPVQMISVATSFIPFLEHDDANRALMGSNMQRQAVPLIRPERPLIGTGLEARAVSDSGHALLTKKSGYVAYVSGSKILIYTL